MFWKCTSSLRIAPIDSNDFSSPHADRTWKLAILKYSKQWQIQGGPGLTYTKAVAPDYILRPKIMPFNTKIRFLKKFNTCFAQHIYFLKVTYFCQKPWIFSVLAPLSIDWNLYIEANPAFGWGEAQLWLAQFCQHNRVESCKQSELTRGWGMGPTLGPQKLLGVS